MSNPIEITSVSDWNTTLRASTAAGQTVSLCAPFILPSSLFLPPTLHLHASGALLIDPKQVIVDAYATWCGPCKAIAPVFDNLAKSCDWVKYALFPLLLLWSTWAVA